MPLFRMISCILCPVSSVLYIVPSVVFPVSVSYKLYEMYLCADTGAGPGSWGLLLGQGADLDNYNLLAHEDRINKA